MAQDKFARLEKDLLKNNLFWRRLELDHLPKKNIKIKIKIKKPRGS
jgi:hypothetical protein